MQVQDTDDYFLVVAVSHSETVTTISEALCLLVNLGMTQDHFPQFYYPLVILKVIFRFQVQETCLYFPFFNLLTIVIRAKWPSSHQPTKIY